MDPGNELRIVRYGVVLDTDVGTSSPSSPGFNPQTAPIAVKGYDVRDVFRFDEVLGVAEDAEDSDIYAGPVRDKDRGLRSLYHPFCHGRCHFIDPPGPG